MWWFLALRLAETNTNELHGGGTDRPCVRTGGGGGSPWSQARVMVAWAARLHNSAVSGCQFVLSAQ